MTDQALQLLIVVGGAAASVTASVLAWSLKRNAKGQDEKLTAIATDLRQVASTVVSHGERLTAGAEAFRQLREDVRGLLERDRCRCLNGCRWRASQREGG